LDGARNEDDAGLMTRGAMDGERAVGGIISINEGWIEEVDTSGEDEEDEGAAGSTLGGGTAISANCGVGAEADAVSDGTAPGDSTEDGSSSRGEEADSGDMGDGDDKLRGAVNCAGGTIPLNNEGAMREEEDDSSSAGG